MEEDNSATGTGGIGVREVYPSTRRAMIITDENVENEIGDSSYANEYQNVSFTKSSWICDVH